MNLTVGCTHPWYRWILVVGVLVSTACVADDVDRSEDLSHAEPAYVACESDADCPEPGGRCLEDGRSFEDGESGSGWNEPLSVCTYDCETDADCPGDRDACLDLYGVKRCALPCGPACPDGTTCEWHGAEICMWAEELVCVRDCE